MASPSHDRHNFFRREIHDETKAYILKDNHGSSFGVLNGANGWIRTSDFLNMSQAF